MKKGFDYTGVTIVFFCHDGGGRYLMHKRTDNCRDEHHTWDPGAGGLKFGEKVEDALKREIREEYQTSVHDVEFLGYRDVHREHDGEKTHWIALDYRVHIDGSSVGIGEPHKCAELKWVTIDNLPKPLHSQFPLFLETYKDKL